MTKARIFMEAFLDGFSGAGFYERLRRPGAPTQVFADSTPEDLPTMPAYAEGADKLNTENKELTVLGR